MRIIKFRGKVHGEWWHVTPEDTNWAEFWASVNRATVGQNTGLKDKNGTEVYEHDLIVSNLNEEIERVYYANNYAAYGPFSHLLVYDSERWIDVVESFEVVGNIHDNPELCQGG